MLTAVVDKNGVPGMPTYNIKKVRRMLDNGKAKIYAHRPVFTIQLLEKEFLAKQDVELCMDAGYQHIGVSVKSEKHEFAHAQYDLLPDEKQRHDDRRSNRRNRRGRLRYRKPGRGSQSQPEGWLAPSVKNKHDRHVDIVNAYAKVMPVSSVTIETASFDTQLLQAVEQGLDKPEGKDYQRGPRYMTETLRDAVFYRDKHTCLICGEKDKILRVHHIGFWKTPSDHTDRIGNLATVCTGCHTSANHKPGGKLYGWEPKLKPLTGAAFMNTVRWSIYAVLKKKYKDVHMTYGAETKASRKEMCIEKTHANDAYCMGQFHPGHRSRERLFTKRRRNNRILEKFYDAKYIDMRDGKKKKGAELSCGRTDRSEPRNGKKNLRLYRGQKVSAGRRTVRKKRYPIRPGDVVLYNGKKRIVKGVQHYGEYISLKTGCKNESVKTKDVKILYHEGGWQEEKNPG